MSYIRICKGLVTSGDLYKLPIDLYKISEKDMKSTWFYSTYQYNDDHKKIFDEKHSIRGIRDVTTNSLWWDIDCEGNLDNAKKSADIIINRLIDKGVDKDAIQIRFSGGKGYHVIVDTQDTFTPSEVKNIAIEIGGDLDGFDDSMYDASQIFRVPLSVNDGSGLYCRPLTLDAFKQCSTAEIIEMARDVSSVNREALKGYYKRVPTPLELITISKIVRKREVKSEVTTFDVTKIDFTKKPTFLDNATWALQLGYFRGGESAALTGDVGERNNAFLYLAATYKSKGFDKLSTYHLLKGVAEAQSSRTGEDQFDNDRLWTTIIDQVYSPEWNGGKHRIWVEESYVPKYKIPQIEYTVDAKIVSATEGFTNFLEYAKKIDEYRFEFGIKELDDKLRARTGYLIGMLAPPACGKCLKNGTEVMMYDGSIKKIERVAIGDKLMGADSTPRNVLKVGHGEAPTYTIIPIKGEAWSCIGSHILSLKCSADCSKLYSKGSIHNISVEDYLKLPSSIAEKLKLYRTPVEFETKEVKYDPYIIGYWLGDGARGKPQITCGYQDADIMEPIFKQFCDKNSLILNRTNSKTAVDFSFVTKLGRGGATSNPFLDEIRRFSVDKSKFIINEYLINDRHTRLQLLAGLLDSDGYLSDNTFDIVTKSEQLKDNIIFLVQTLGFYISYSNKYVNGMLYYRMSISGNTHLIPTRHNRKKASIRKQKKDVLVTGFSVEREDINHYTGVELDGDHLYLLKDTTVTHNTSFAITALNNTSKMGKKSIVFSYDMAESVLFQKLIQRETGSTEKFVFDTIKRATNGETLSVKRVEEWGKVIADNYTNSTFVFKSGQSIKEIKRTIMETEISLGDQIPFIIIDYSELILSQFSDPTQASAEVIQGLREIANEMNKCVLVLLQPNKMNSKPNEPLLDYNCAKGSSAIAQAVTIMITAHRPGMDCTNPDDDRFFSINCVKNRMGQLFSVDFGWEGLTGKITPLTPTDKVKLKSIREKNKEDIGGDF